MRTCLFLTLGCFFLACGSSDSGTDSPGDGANGGTNANAAGNSGLPDGGPEAGAGGAGYRGEIGTPMQIAPGQALLGVTSDGWVVFRDADVLRAANLADPSSIQEITDRPGNVLIRGRVVFNWADIDWQKGVGDLSVWTADAGAQAVGSTPYSETLVSASADGSTIVYTANTRELTNGAGGAATDSDAGGAGGQAPAPERATDLMIASSDLGSSEILIESMGLGSENTCGANLGFVGERLFVGWCPPGSRDAKIERYELDGSAWTPTTIAENALPAWSTDAQGERVFYQSSGYSGYVSVDGEAVLIDAGVSQGVLLPDGKTVLYSVGDQLRRTSVPGVNPVAIVTTGYKQPVRFSPDFSLALYSTTVTYEMGTQRDLFLATTDKFNPNPLALVEKPVATLARSSMTRDGKFVFYLTGVTPSGGTLHVVDHSGSEVLTLPNVVEAVSGKGSLLLFTDNASDPDTYPVVADLKAIELSHEDEPRLIEAKVLDGKNIQVDSEGTVVSYVRSGVGQDPEDPQRNGVFSVSIR